jgi:gliding motility-associated lipoprotein GldK
MDDTEITNNEYRQFMNEILEDSLSVLGEDFVMRELYPDTTVWVKDFTHHMGDPMMSYYYWHPAFDDYPVSGVDWEAAKYFCRWRTQYLNDYRQSIGDFPMPNFRLPSEAEWEYAARGGRDMAKYPWGNPYIRNSKGCMLANFKPGRGNYYDDGFAYTAPIQSYFANDYGLYDMAGNVSEWVEDAFNPASVSLVWDLNLTYFDENEPKKVIRGGSWKDIAFFLETGTRTFEYKDSTRAYIGFRCALTHLGRSSGREFQ